MDNQSSGPAEEAGDLSDLTGNCKAAESESEAVLALQDRIKWPEQKMVKKVQLLNWHD
jgi:hypothetical protein